jgi:hypothetical protein
MPTLILLFFVRASIACSRRLDCAAQHSKCRVHTTNVQTCARACVCGFLILLRRQDATYHVYFLSPGDLKPLRAPQRLPEVDDQPDSAGGGSGGEMRMLPCTVTGAASRMCVECMCIS